MMKTKKLYLVGLALLCFSVVLIGGVVPAQADVTWDWMWNGMGTKMGDYPTPTNGWVTLNVTNNTNFAWGDMHFEILSCTSLGCSAIDNVGFVDGFVDGMTSPDSDRSPFTYSIDNGTVGATLDYFYYSDPILTGGDTGMFKFKVTNPDGTLYTLAVTPSIVPEPVSSTLFLVGAATLGFRRFRKKSIAA
jgi:hypothetical protein